MWQAFVTDPLLAAQKNDATDETLAKGRVGRRLLILGRVADRKLQRPGPRRL